MRHTGRQLLRSLHGQREVIGALAGFIPYLNVTVVDAGCPRHRDGWSLAGAGIWCAGPAEIPVAVRYGSASGVKIEMENERLAPMQRRRPVEVHAGHLRRWRYGCVGHDGEGET